MEKIKVDILGLSTSQSQIGSYALVLGEENGNRRLPIIIGGFEAQAIALELENIKPNRPMTHDLLVTVSRAYNIELEEVVISDLKEGVFYSKMIFFRDNEYVEIDARPSDAIAIAVRYRAPVYVYSFILDDAGIEVKEGADADGDDTETETETKAPEPQQEKPKPEKAAGGMNRQELLKSLHNRMEAAIARENYEEAARLRDEITKLEDN